MEGFAGELADRCFNGVHHHTFADKIERVTHLGGVPTITRQSGFDAVANGFHRRLRAFAEWVIFGEVFNQRQSLRRHQQFTSNDLLGILNDGPGLARAPCRV